MQTAIAPYPVKEQHLKGIFGDFETVVQDRIATLTCSNDPLAKDKVAFFEFLLKDVKPETFRTIQEHYLDANVIRQDSDLIKYVDPIFWFESKLTSAHRLKLHVKPPMRILDIGTGPGHFPVVARFYGHKVTGTDLPRPHRREAHLYDALTEFYGVERILEPIRPMESLGEKFTADGRYDLVTAFLAAFNLDNERRPWTKEMWDFFFCDLKKNVLTPNGAVFMSLNKKVPDDVWAYLTSKAEWSKDIGRPVYISDFEPFMLSHATALPDA